MSNIDKGQISTKAQRDEAARIAQAETLIAQAKDVLQSTDWYVVRRAETGAPIPQDVIEARDAARAQISGERELLAGASA